MFVFTFLEFLLNSFFFSGSLKNKSAVKAGNFIENQRWNNLIQSLKDLSVNIEVSGGVNGEWVSVAFPVFANASGASTELVKWSFRM
jgi:hypothetical protein